MNKELFKVLGSDAKKDYHGCGNAWAAIKDNEIKAIRYMQRFCWESEEIQSLDFETYRAKCRKELSEIGEVISGMCSCYEFIKK